MRLVLAAVAALLVGTVAGGIGMLLVKQAGRSTQSAPPPNPQESMLLQGLDGQNMNTAEIAPILDMVQLSGTSVLLKWRDPTQGEATFVVVRVEGGVGNPVTAVDRGRTEITLEGVQSSGKVCYLLIALMADKRGFSPQKCSGGTTQ
jgi:hypothetical protein